MTLPGFHRQKNANHDPVDQSEEIKIKNVAVRSSVGKNSFKNVNLTKMTQNGLKKAGFHQMSPIQEQSLPHALSGRDILGAASTGSGKTLAFILPVLEKLSAEGFGPQDGLGALILSPTRELAQQIFDVINAVGRNHQLSAGMLIGGNGSRGKREETKRVMQMNVLIATPGRVLEHLDNTVGLHCHNLKILVLDEADRLLDLGFKPAVNAIIDHLPQDRQSLLFSATLTRRVQDLASLSLKDPVYLNVSEDKYTPDQLKQQYAVVELEDKLTTLWNFLYQHVNEKVIVFFSTCKQLSYATALFEYLVERFSSKVRLYNLSGRKSQLKRETQLELFKKGTKGVLLTTNVAARGLDLPNVSFVVQVDAPNDVEDYIHRVGRTARYNKSGSSIVFLMPQEFSFLDALKKKNIEPSKVDVAIRVSLKKAACDFCAQDMEGKQKAQRALTGFSRFVRVGQNANWRREWQDWNWSGFSYSLGLIGSPIIKAKANNVKVSVKFADGYVSGDEDDFFEKAPDNKDKPIGEITLDADHASCMSQRRIDKINKRAKNVAKIAHIKFIAGEPVHVNEFETEEQFSKTDVNGAMVQRLEVEQEKLKVADSEDRKVARQKRKQLRAKLREKELQATGDNVANGIQLGSASSSEDIEMDEDGARNVENSALSHDRRNEVFKISGQRISDRRKSKRRKLEDV